MLAKIRTGIPIVAFLLFYQCTAQTLSTKETKVVLIVDSEAETITGVALFAEVQKMGKARLGKSSRECNYYIGLLRGSYEISGDFILPKEGSTIIMYTEKRIFPEADFSRGDELMPGDRFNLGKIRAKVVSSKKGELVLRT